MPMQSNPHETRSATVLRHVQAYLRETGTSEWTYAQHVVDIYHLRTAPTHRTVHFADSGDAYRMQKTNAGHIGRFIAGTQRLPVDLEESCVLALPAERQRGCWVDLAARVGRISIAHPQDGVQGVADDLGKLSRDIGDVYRTLGVLLGDDNQIDHTNRALDLHAARESARRLAGQVGSVVECLSGALIKQQESIEDDAA